MILGVIERLKQLRNNKLVAIFIKNVSNDTILNMILPKLPLKNDEIVILANYLDKVSQEAGKPLSEIILSDDFLEIIESLTSIFQSATKENHDGGVVGADAKIYSGE